MNEERHRHKWQGLSLMTFPAPRPCLHLKFNTAQVVCLFVAGGVLKSLLQAAHSIR